MATDDLPTIRILKPGSFTDIHGTKVTFTAADLAEVMASYNAESDPAPLVIGHPKHDDPAFGWVGALRMDGDTLVATPSSIAPALADAVRDKSYRTISASLYPPRHPANPQPGKWGLKHVGFLGASRPAVKGLGTVAFSDADDDAALTILPEQEQNMTDTPEAIALAERETALSDREAAIAERENGVTAREAELIAGERLAIHDGNVAFAESLIDDAKLAPTGRVLVIGVLDALSDADAVSFGEDLGELRPADAFRRLFDTASPIVALGEAAPADKPAPDADKSPDVIAEQAVSFVESEREAGRTVTVQAAVRHVMRGDD